MSNKRIAKNTVLLYFRMLLTMGVSLYTSRIVLNTLGVEDFGIYNVVGGVVIMFSFFNSAMSSATQRFLTIELGKKDYEALKKVFSMSVNIHALIALIALILAETAGLWFLNTQLVIPEARMEAANWVYQASILAFMLAVMGVPYNAIIIANERMNVYAYVSIIDVILKLIIVFALVWVGYDKLKLYAILVFCVAAIIWLLYKSYCKRNFTETNYSYCWDKTLYKTMMHYAGWNLFGNLAAVTMGQGINIILNLFFGPVVNSARGIAYQVNAAVSGFVGNFQMAMNPQIIKSYAADDRRYMHQLIFQGAKYSFFLLFIIALPLLIETETILRWWLKIVPENTVLFCRLVLINSLIDCISGPLMTAAQATGKIKTYQTVVGGLLLLILPISYVFLKKGFPPEITLYVSISISIVALFTRLFIISPLVNLSILTFVRIVLARILLVAMMSVILPLIIKQSMNDELIEYLSLYIPLIIKYSLNQELIRFFTICIVSVLSVAITTYCLGLRKEEKLFIKNRVITIFFKNKKQSSIIPLFVIK